jgi:hypothetical protein
VTKGQIREAIIAALAGYVDIYGSIGTEEDIARAALVIFNALGVSGDDQDKR